MHTILHEFSRKIQLFEEKFLIFQNVNTFSFMYQIKTGQCLNQGIK